MEEIGPNQFFCNALWDFWLTEWPGVVGLAAVLRPGETTERNSGYNSNRSVTNTLQKSNETETELK